MPSQGPALTAPDGPSLVRWLATETGIRDGVLTDGHDAWFETGDLARFRADGYVEILGRSGLSVKRDGLLVVFADVEAAVEKVEGIQRAVVVASGETRRGARLVAVCLATANGLHPDTVRQTCFDLLPRYAVPDEVILVDTLPHLPSGKVDRRAVRDMVATRTS